MSFLFWGGQLGHIPRDCCCLNNKYSSRWLTSSCRGHIAHVATQVFFAILLISDRKVKSPSIPRSTSTKASNKPSTSRGVSHGPVASPGPGFTSDGWIRRQPCGRGGSNPRCLRNTSALLKVEQRPEGTRLISVAVPYAASFAPVTWVRVHLSSFRPQRRRYDLCSLSCVVR